MVAAEIDGGFDIPAQDFVVIEIQFVVDDGESKFMKVSVEIKNLGDNNMRAEVGEDLKNDLVGKHQNAAGGGIEFSAGAQSIVVHSRRRRGGGRADRLKRRQSSHFSGAAVGASAPLAFKAFIPVCAQSGAFTNKNTRANI